jgi:hypothetical protein
MSYNTTTIGPPVTRNAVTISKELSNALREFDGKVHYESPYETKVPDFAIRPLPFRIDVIHRYQYVIDRYKETINDPISTLRLVFDLREKYTRNTSCQLELQLSKLVFRLLVYRSLSCHKDKEDVHSEYYLEGTLKYGPVYTEYVKKLRNLAFIQSTSDSMLKSTKADIQQILDRGFLPRLDISRKYNYDDFLSEQYLILWEEIVDDFKYAFLPVTEDREIISSFKLHSLLYLSKYKIEEIIHPDETERLTWISDSQTFDGERSANNRVYLRSIIKEGTYHEKMRLTKNFSFKRAIIPVSPGNFRDSWEPDISTLFTIKYLSFILRQITAELPNSAMADSITALRRKRCLQDIHSNYIMIDLKKAGLTLNRSLISIVKESLLQIYGDKTFEYLDGYQNCKVLSNQKVFYPIRGSGLGNANELMTIIQCIIGSMIESLAPGERSIFFNDDSVFVTKRRSYQSLAFIMLVYQGLGLILNRGKCIFSRGNVFLEEYLLEDYYGVDYSKYQLLLLPFVECFFQQEIWQSKRLFYSLDRGLIGTGVNAHFAFLNILKRNYEFRFREYVLPYHFGGWYDSSRTNFSDCLRFIYEPSEILDDPNDLGPIPFWKEWIFYNLRQSEIDGESLLKKTQIPFKEHVEKPLKVFLFDNPGNENSWIYDMIGELKPSQFNKTFEDLYNFRGLKNAKPHVKSGMAVKIRLSRRRSFKRFLELRSVINFRNEACYGDIILALKYIKGHVDAPDNISIPSILVKTRGHDVRPNLDKNLIVKKPVYKARLSSYQQLNRTVESMMTGSVWYHGSDPFAFRSIRVKRKYGKLISSIGIPPKDISINKLSPFLQRFGCRSDLLQFDYFLKHNGRTILEERSSLPSGQTWIDPLRIDPIITLYPEKRKKWKDLVSLHKSRLRVIQRYFSEVNLYSPEEFEAHMDALHEVLSYTSDKRGDRNLISDDDLLETVDSLKSRQINNPVFEEEMQERTVDELLEFEDIDQLLEEEYNSSNSEYGAPRFNEDEPDPELESVKSFHSTNLPWDPDGEIEAEEMVSDDEVSNLELRRIHREEDESSDF